MSTSDTFVYRVVSLREGNARPRVKEYKSLKGAERRYQLIASPEPWVAIGRKPDELYCCTGQECSCDGITVRECMERDRKRYPKLLSAKIERRRVEPWETLRQHVPEDPKP